MAETKSTTTKPAAKVAAVKTPAKPGQQPTPKTAQRAPAFRMEKIAKRTRYLKLLIYGNYGVGKTYLAGTSAGVAGMNDVLLINAEAGDLTLIDDPVFENIMEITITNFQQLGRIHEFIRQHCKAREEGDIETLKKLEAAVRGLEPGEIEEPKQFHTVIIDSLTEVEAYCMNQLLGETDTTRIDEEVQGAEWGEYKKNQGMILRLIRRFRDLPLHVIFTAAESYTQDETKKQKFTPAMTGQLSKKIQGAMDMVGYYAMARTGDETARRLYVMPSPTGKFDAKHRYQKFKGDFFQDPTIGTILKEVGLLDKDGASLK